MRRFLASLCLLLTLAACGGSGSAPSISIPIPEAQASAPEACPTGDATAQLQAMIDSAKGSLALPACTFKTSAPLVITKPIHLYGEGERATFIVSSAAEAIQVAPQGCVGQGNRSHFHGFAVDPAVGGAGKAAMVIRLKAEGDCINNFEIEHLYLGDFGPVGLLVDNVSGKAPSAFVGVIRFNRITNGFKGIALADSVRIYENSMPDGPASRAARAGNQWGVDITTVGGAAQLVIRDNNITTPGGCIRIKDAANVKLLGNWCEFPAHYGYSNTGQAATVQLTNINRSKIAENLIEPGKARFAMVLDGLSQYNVLDSNDLGLGTEGHLAFMGAASRNKQAGLPYFRYVPDPLIGTISGAESGLISTP